ncbi:MAG: hypothetical protein K9N51_01340 [Candidatus Pacebacteria bacterium]|nr:hypothetical protein [Candidatus Paceibacterota bacterium]
MPAYNRRDIVFEDIGSRRELMVDDHLIWRMSGAVDLRLHRPVPREIALETDQPWEGDTCGYITVFQDDDKYLMYYRGSKAAATHAHASGKSPIVLARAESDDGIHWTRPEYGLHEFEGSKNNNIVFAGAEAERCGVHGFAPFKDLNPQCDPQARYKAIGAPGKNANQGLYVFQSPDGLHWTLVKDGPVITKGRFDSQDLAFWDSPRGEYRVYFRDSWRGEVRRFRDIKTCTSPDFIHWTEPEWLAYPGAEAEEMYTNQIIPYYRAPHIFLGFPTRYVDRGWCLNMENLSELKHRRMRADTDEPRSATALTDGLFMASRDGKTFYRWDEAFIRPGPQLKGNWVYGDNYQCWGVVPTRSSVENEPGELSVYATENYRRFPTRIRRYSLRMDGFASVHASGRGGEFVTKPIRFDGSKLLLNFATSAAGSIRIEIQDAQGAPFDHFRLEEAPEIFGDAVDQVVPWNEKADLCGLCSKPVRLRFVMKDADLYAFRFFG